MSKPGKSTDLVDMSIFHLLGAHDMRDEEREECLRVLERQVWDDFLRDDLPLLITDAEMKDVEEMQRQLGNGERLFDSLGAYLSGKIGDLDEIILERATVLKKKLVEERIRSLVHILESDSGAIAEHFKSVRFDEDLFSLIKRVAHANNDDACASAAWYKPLAANPAASVAEKVPVSPKTASPKPKASIGDMMFDAVMKSPVLLAEEAFLKRVPAGVVFSYRADSRDKLLNDVTVRSLETLRRRYLSKNDISSHFFMAVIEFRTIIGRVSDTEFNYEKLAEKIGSSILCLEELDLICSLSNNEYKNLLAFFKKNNNRRFFFFGDFSAGTAARSSRMKELEDALNIRDIDAKQITVDETGILCAAFEAADLSVPPDAEESLTRAWNQFRDLHQEERMEDVMRTFVQKTEFATVGKDGGRVLRTDSFKCLGLPDIGFPKQDHAHAVFPRPRALLMLDEMVGMAGVKSEIEQLAAHAFVTKKKVEAGLIAEPETLSFLFLGNPGTGKTTVACILAQTLRELRVLKKGHLVTAHRGTLIAPYVGQTAPLVADAFMSALDGVLFIDEAYSLYTADLSLDSYGKEAINTLTLLMSEYAGRIAVIFAGYPKEMDYMLSSVNPGLRDRFVYKFTFEDYTEEELWAIFSNKLRTMRLVMEDGGGETIRKKIANMYRDRDERFANARIIDNMLQVLVNIQETRIASHIWRGGETDPSKLAFLTVEDCEKLLESKVCQYAANHQRPVGFAR